ncbi:MAG: hypothetical protein QOJ63_974, partial [Solirubrobacteraceae bacterium]|nr:hypothetical protein [Solirubrobacteraceae bacterium]
MGSRSRRRERTAPRAQEADAAPAPPTAARSDAAAPEPAAAPDAAATPAPARPDAAAPAPAPARPDAPAPEPATATRPEPAAPEHDPPPNRYARGRARDEAVRQGLEPLAPGERPRVVTIAAIVAFAFAAANVVATLTVDGLSTDQGDPTLFAVITTSVLVLAGIGMLARRYWAVLGFEVILGLQIVVFSLALTRVQKWWLAIALTIAIGLL